jgi:hypothetical protein
MLHLNGQNNVAIIAKIKHLTKVWRETILFIHPVRKKFTNTILKSKLPSFVSFSKKLISMRISQIKILESMKNNRLIMGLNKV